jgi:heme-degrading monooxygenase HmoA
MRARSNSVQVDPAAVDRLADYVREDVMGMYRDMPGFVGVSMLADRDSGRCIITTAWESEEAMRASDEGADASRAEASAMTGGAAFQVERWDLAVLHRAHETHEGACARVVWASGGTGTDPGMDGALDAWRSTALPTVEAMDGFCSISLMVDREGQRAVACTAYDSREAMAGNADAASALRDRMGPATGMTVDEVAEFEVVLAHLRVPEMA